MRQLNCRTCGKLLIQLEKGVIAKQGAAIYCVEHDPAKASKAPSDFSELFRSFGKK